MPTTLEKTNTVENSSKWIAVSLKDPKKVLFESIDPKKLHEKASKSGIEFMLKFVPDPNSKFIF